MKCVSHINYIKSEKRVLFSELTQEENQDICYKFKMQFMKGLGGYEPDKKFLKENPKYEEYWDHRV